MKKQFKIFISSVQDEFAAERKLLKKWLTTDPYQQRGRRPLRQQFPYNKCPAHNVSGRAEQSP